MSYEKRNPPQRYEEILPISRHEAISLFHFGLDSEAICKALLSVALHDEDWKWAQAHCLRFLEHSNPEVRRVAAVGLGHVARIHGHLDRRRVVMALNSFINRDINKKIAGAAQDALDDIDLFLAKDGG